MKISLCLVLRRMIGTVRFLAVSMCCMTAGINAGLCFIAVLIFKTHAMDGVAVSDDGIVWEKYAKPITVLPVQQQKTKGKVRL